jgi:two-component system, OmpR family, response regulator
MGWGGRCLHPGSQACPEIGLERAMAGSSVLVVDDEPGILRFVSRALRAEGFDVQTAANGEAGLRSATSGCFDLIILDLLMPGTDGVHVLDRLLRQKPDQAVLVLSCLTDTASKVRCLDMGAVDFLDKPFALEELLARVNVRLRRRPTREPRTLTSPGLALDLVRQEVKVGTKTVSLTQREAMLLAELMDHAGVPVSKQRLLSAVWGYYFSPGTNVLDVYVKRLRGKLGPELISTVRGVGYGLDIN